ncbi:MAG: GyrI-like domain-containing protein [Phototrophicaceae bacterium]
MVKTTEVLVEDRPEKHYMGIRVITPSSEFPNMIPQLIDEVFGWLGENGIEADGAPIMRYYVINMEGEMDVEIGVFVANPATGDDRVKASILPAGRYASLIYTGVKNGIAGNGVLIQWAKDKDIEWDRWDEETGDAFRSRYEVFIDGPEDDPDPSNWRTEVAIKMDE